MLLTYLLLFSRCDIAHFASSGEKKYCILRVDFQTMSKHHLSSRANVIDIIYKRNIDVT